MKQRPWRNLVVVLGLLAGMIGVSPGQPAPASLAQARAPAVLYVKPEGMGDCSSWETACELQEALQRAGAGDEIWVQEGEYKPTEGINYASCQEIRAASPAAPDGDYLINNEGNAFQVYCDNMDGTPVEYLSLWDSDENYAQYTAGGASPGTNVRTNYSRVRLLPDTLQIDISDNSYSTSVGSLQHAGGATVTSMYYAVAMDCLGNGSYQGVGRIDLRDTPFWVSLSPDPFRGCGYAPGGGWIWISPGQELDLWGGGNCGWFQPSGDCIYDPFHSEGEEPPSPQPILELSYLRPERRAAFQLQSGVALYGGFTGTEGNREERDPQNNLTVLSGDIDDDDTTDPDGVVTDTAKLRGYNSFHVVVGSGVDASAVLDGFTITAGMANGQESDLKLGGGMYNDTSSPALNDVTFSGNRAAFGGGMYNDNSSPTLTNVIFSGNEADVGVDGDGGGMNNASGSNPTLTNVTFFSNTATRWGGGMSNGDSHPELINVTFSGNTADDEGGGIYNWNSSPVLTNCILWGNTATNNGDQIYNASSTPTIGYSDVQGGCPTGSTCDHVEDADPLFVDADTGDLRLQITSPAIDAGDNSAVPLEITIDLGGHPRFVDVPSIPDTGCKEAEDDRPLVDMGAYEARYCDVPSVLYPLIQDAVDDPTCVTINLAAGTFNEDVTISRAVTIQGQGAGLTFEEGSGGPVFLIQAGGVVTLTSMTIQNISNDYDGVIVNYGTLTVKESSVSDNSTVFGGGIGNDGTLYVTNSTLSNNSAASGGGIHNTGILTVTNSTLTNNVASGGGGILNDGGTVYVTNSTLSGNTANGGGILNGGGVVYVTNSIVAQNSPSDCSGAITSLGHNLDSDGSCGLDLSLSDLPNTDPILGPLQDNGGPTLTQALLEGSPAIDAGGENCPSTDQRGVPRPQDGDGDGLAQCDMGAYEAQYVLVYLPVVLRGAP